jgi:hypothetical protein
MPLRLACLCLIALPALHEGEDPGDGCLYDRFESVLHLSSVLEWFEKWRAGAAHSASIESARRFWRERVKRKEGSEG